MQVNMLVARRCKFTRIERLTALMWAWMVVAPWWVRWLVSASVAAVTLTVIFALGGPSFVVVTGWRWRLAALVVFSLAVAAVVVIIQNPVRHTRPPSTMRFRHEA